MMSSFCIFLKRPSFDPNWFLFPFLGLQFFYHIVARANEIVNRKSLFFNFKIHLSLHEKHSFSSIIVFHSFYQIPCAFLFRRGYKKAALVWALSAPCISEICIKIKFILNLYFHTSLKLPPSTCLKIVRIML